MLSDTKLSALMARSKWKHHMKQLKESNDKGDPMDNSESEIPVESSDTTISTDILDKDKVRNCGCGGIKNNIERESSLETNQTHKPAPEHKDFGVQNNLISKCEKDPSYIVMKTFKEQFGDQIDFKAKEGASDCICLALGSEPSSQERSDEENSTEDESSDNEESRDHAEEFESEED